jgi:hypothetical protein
LKKEKSWGDWLKVGEALQVGREWAMNQAGTNRPDGKGYNVAFSEWLQKYKLDDMDKGDRSRLFSVMDNLGQIEEWRKTLPLNQRLSLNHPNAVVRKWKAFMKPEERTATGDPKPTLRDSVANLSEEITAKDRRIAELEALVQELEAARVQQPSENAKPPGDPVEACIEALKRMNDKDFGAATERIQDAIDESIYVHDRQLADSQSLNKFLAKRAAGKK